MSFAGRKEMMDDETNNTNEEAEFHTDEESELEFLLSGDEVAESFIGLTAQNDPQLIRTVFSNTTLLFLSNARGNSEEMDDEDLRQVLVDSANQAFDLIVQELAAIRDAKISFAQGIIGPLT